MRAYLHCEELSQRGVQLVVLRLGESTEKMIEVIRRKYSSSCLKLKVCDAGKDAKALRQVVSKSSTASYGESVMRLSQSKGIQGQRLNYVVEDCGWSGRADWQAVEAQVYTYFMEDLDEPTKTSRRPFSALIAPTPFGRGAMRFAFYVIDQQYPDRKYVGKVYQFADPVFQQKSAYEGDMASQAVAALLAKEFTVWYPENPIEFVQAQLLDLGASTAFPFRFMAIEPWIPGDYEKYTSNAGHISKDSDLAQAFSHFTWDFTSGELMVADIQGVNKTTLTDPQIHSQDTDRYGRGNLSTKGMDIFFMNHVCNDICRTLKLQANPHQPGSIQHDPDTFAQEGEALECIPEGDEGPSDWMPLANSKLSAFLKAVREDAGRLQSSEQPEQPASDWLGGACVRWADLEITDVKSEAKAAGCMPGAVLKLVGGTNVQQKSRKEVLELLAKEENMIFATASPKKIEEMRPGSDSDDVEIFEGLKCLQELLELPAHLHALQALLGASSRGLPDLPLDMKNGMFLAALREDSSRLLGQPDGSEGWDEQLGVPCDTLGGASFAWTSPPRVTAVAEGSPAHGTISEGPSARFDDLVNRSQAWNLWQVNRSTAPSSVFPKFVE